MKSDDEPVLNDISGKPVDMGDKPPIWADGSEVRPEDIDENALYSVDPKTGIFTKIGSA